MARSAIVTGAAGGIGSATVAWFRDRGWVVVAVDREGSAYADDVVAVDGDVTAAGVLERAVEQAATGDLQLSALVNNAVQRDHHDVVSSTDADWNRVFEVNVMAAVRAMRLALPHMLRQRSGAIVNVASIAGLSGLRGRAAYSASKGALIALTKQAALDYTESGIRINCVCPGATNTEAIRSRFSQFGSPETVAATFGAQQLLGRLVEPSEVAATIGFLCDDAPDAISGQAIVIDGGSSLLTPADLSSAIDRPAGDQASKQAADEES
jgi:2-keto-3-deoxy-L-fuconate dehydrogenase